MSQRFDVVVIGEGIAGLWAARRLSEQGLSVATFESSLFGGLVANVSELDPSPDEKIASGFDLAASLADANADRGITSIAERVTALDVANDIAWLRTPGFSYQARAVVAASGARLRTLGIPGEAAFEGSGVSHCADCDGPLFQGQDAIVAGGGNSAVQEALVLARYCRSVHLVLRGEKFRADQSRVNRLRAAANVSIWPDTVIEEIVGNGRVEGTRLRRSDGTALALECAAVFPFVGVEPNADYLSAEIRRDAAGALVTDERLLTTSPLLWAAGAVRSGYGGTLADAMNDGDRAAESIAARLRR